MGVLQVPQVLADQLLLARVHQHRAVPVVDEEVAVVAVVHRLQGGQSAPLKRRFFQRGALRRCRGRERLQHANGQVHVILELGAAGVHVGLAHQGLRLPGQRPLLVEHRHADGQQAQQQRQRGQQDNLGLQLHKVKEVSRGAHAVRAMLLQGGADLTAPRPNGRAGHLPPGRYPRHRNSWIARASANL